MPTLIKNGTVVNADGQRQADVLFAGETISQVGPNLPSAGHTVVDATGLLVMPGGVDVHTHLDMPFGGTVSADDYRTGTIAAAVGGTTTVIDFVLHGDGPAASWAANAVAGSLVGQGGPRGSLVVSDDFDWYLLAGDETALPSIARRLEELPPGCDPVLPPFVGPEEAVAPTAAFPVLDSKMELKAKEVTPPPPGVRPFASRPCGVPAINVIYGVTCTGARS